MKYRTFKAISRAARDAATVAERVAWLALPVVAGLVTWIAIEAARLEWSLK